MQSILLFVVVMFYKVTEDSKVANTGLFPLEEVTGLVTSYENFSSCGIFVNWAIYNFVFCVFLVKAALYSIYCWFINIELM